MATTDFNLGAIAKVDRDNRTHKTKDGQWIVIVKTSDNDKKADIEVFDSEDDAKKVAAEVLGSGAGTGTRPSPLITLTNMSKIQTSNVTGNVESVMKTRSIYDGKKIKDIALPITIGGVFQGVTTTDATIEHTGTTFAYVFKHGGHTIKVATTEEDVKKNLGMAPEPTYAVKVREAILGKTLLEALKSLKGSKTLGATDVCAKELEQVLMAAGIITSGLFDFNDSNDRAQLAAMAAALKPAATGLGLTHEVAVEAAVSLPISDSSCVCLMLLTDEGSVADGFSDISDDAHGYEAEEEEDDHADFPPHNDDLEEEGVSERERARRPAGLRAGLPSSHKAVGTT